MTGAEVLQFGTAFTLCMVPPIIVMHLLVKLLIVTVQLLAITGVLNLNNYTYQLIYETIIYIFFSEWMSACSSVVLQDTEP